MRRVLSISLGLTLFLTGCNPNDEDEAMRTLQKACGYLWSQQADDGGWHSETHGILRSGESLTPFILYALLQAGSDGYLPEKEDVDRAMNFIRRSISAKISSDTIPQILDYPNYTAAYALMVFTGHGGAEDSIYLRHLTTYLQAQQFDEDRGIAPAHPAYGGWGFGENTLKQGKVGHVDLSHTRRVCEALRTVLPSDDPVFRKVQIYLKKVQNSAIPGEIDVVYRDGGFFTSIVIPETNKSLPVQGVPDRWYSYATATCDGLLALHAAGVDHSDVRFEQAAKWLSTHSELRYPEGIPHDDPLQWHLAMKYYHLAVRAEACNILGCDSARQDALAKQWIKEQQRNGSFENPNGSPNKEDDPLLATAFAVTALTHL